MLQTILYIFLILLITVLIVAVIKFFNKMEIIGKPNEDFPMPNIPNGNMFGTKVPVKFDLESFKMGVNQGIVVMFMGMYKMWDEGGEVPIVGDFDDVRNELNKNISDLLSSPEKMKEWNTKYYSYIDKPPDSTGLKK